MAAIDEDDKPKKKIAHEIGQDLSLLSVEELAARVQLLHDEISGWKRTWRESAPRARPPTSFSNGRAAHRCAYRCRHKNPALDANL